MATDEAESKDAVEIRVNCPLFKCGWFFTGTDYNVCKKAEWQHWLDYHTENS